MRRSAPERLAKAGAGRNKTWAGFVSSQSSLIWTCLITKFGKSCVRRETKGDGERAFPSRSARA